MPPFPQYLRPGDRVALAATARKVSSEEMEPAIRLFRSWGLEVVVPDGLYAADHQLAGDDSHRAALLQQLFDRDDIRAIICVRGGYGTVRIIDRLDFTRFCEHPSWLVGYSDVTVLHSHIHQCSAIPTLHAVMPINIPPDADCRPCAATEALRKALFGEPLRYEWNSPRLHRAGCAEAPVVGGNLSILYSLAASVSDLDTTGKILFIEDLDEYLYHIDRMMQQLKRSGKLVRLKGLVVGAMSDMHDNAIPFGRTAEEIVREAVEEYGYPVCFNAPFGHIGTENLALPLGVPARLSIESDGSCSLAW